MAKTAPEPGIIGTIRDYAESHSASETQGTLRSFVHRFQTNGPQTDRHHDALPYGAEDLHPTEYLDLGSKMVDAKILNRKVDCRIPFLFIKPGTGDLALRVSHFDGLYGKKLPADITNGLVEGRNFLEFIHASEANRQDFSDMYELIKGLHAAAKGTISRKPVSSAAANANTVLRMIDAIDFEPGESLVDHCYEQIFAHPKMPAFLEQVDAPSDLGPENFRLWIETIASADPLTVKFADRIRLNVREKVEEWVLKFKTDLKEKFKLMAAETALVTAASKKTLASITSGVSEEVRVSARAETVMAVPVAAPSPAPVASPKPSPAAVARAALDTKRAPTRPGAVVVPGIIKPSPMITIAYTETDLPKPEENQQVLTRTVEEFRRFIDAALPKSKRRSSPVSFTEISTLADCLFGEGDATWFDETVDARHASEHLQSDSLKQLGLRGLFEWSEDGIYAFQDFMVQIYYWRKDLRAKGLQTEEARAEFIKILRTLK